MREKGVPDMHTDTKLNTEVKAKGKRNAPYLSVYGCPESYFSQWIHHLKRNSQHE